MDWIMGYLAVGLVMLVALHLDEYEHFNGETHYKDFKLWRELKYVLWIVLAYPFVFGFIMWQDFRPVSYIRARAARQAQDFKLYGC